MGKSAYDVIRAVQDNQPLTDLELRCAIVALNVIGVAKTSAMATILAEYNKEGEISKKSLDKLQRAWDRQGELNKDLETYILGSSYDPRLTREERRDIFLKHTSTVASNLYEGLSKLSKK